jgi:hypothetical protein
MPHMSMFFVMLLKPLAGLVLFFAAFVIARGLLALVPDGRIKRLLTRPVGVRSANPRRYRD